MMMRSVPLAVASFAVVVDLVSTIYPRCRPIPSTTFNNLSSSLHLLALGPVSGCPLLIITVCNIHHTSRMGMDNIIYLLRKFIVTSTYCISFMIVTESWKSTMLTKLCCPGNSFIINRLWNDHHSRVSWTYLSKKINTDYYIVFIVRLMLY